MDRHIVTLLFGVLMVAIIVLVDVLLFRQHAWARFIVNVGIVLIFLALYLRFLR